MKNPQRLSTLGDDLRRYKRPVTWLFAALLLALSVRLLLKNPEPLRQLMSLPPALGLLLLPLAILNFWLVAFRMSLAVERSSQARVPLTAWFRIVVLGQFLNLFVPQSGNVYRGVTLKREHGVTYTAYATGLFTFIWLDTAFGFALCLLVIAALAPGLRLGGFAVLPALTLVIALLVLAPFLAARLLAGVSLRSPLLTRVQALASDLLRSAGTSLRSRGFVLRFLLASSLVMVDQSIILWLCFRAVGLAIDPETAVLFQVVVKLSNQVIVTPGNLGLTEMAFGVLGAAAHGGSLSYGIAAALVFRMLFTSSAIVLGVMFGGLRLLRTQQQAREAP